MFKINYQTGAGNEIAETLEKAMATADDGCRYTQSSIIIEDDDGNEVAIRTWYGCTEGIELMENPIPFGDSGFYGDWQMI